MITLIKELSPFLDSQGRAYCYAKAEGQESGAVIDLDGEITASLLSYRYREAHSEVPSPSDIRQALTVVRGELWSKQPPGQSRNRMWAATVEAIVKSVQDHGDFVGSAKDALERLEGVTRGHLQVFKDLPRNEDQLGVVLVRIGLLLRNRNVELFRPQRRDKARLWCWRELTPAHDAPDTPDPSSRRESGGSGGRDHGRNQHDDTPDTIAEENTILEQILKGDRR